MKRKSIISSFFCYLLITGLMLFLSPSAMATNNSETANAEIGVAYRGHVQNQGNMPKPEGSMISGPDALGTRGQSLRIEGFWINLTGDLPDDAKLVYQVHVENKGWMTPVTDGNFAGTSGESLRVESIRIHLENLPGYDVYYRGHVQNVGDIPQVDGQWGWVKNGEDLGTTGSSLRLEELQVKIVKQPEITYNKAGTYGPKTGMKTIDNDVAIKSDGVVLQNLHIKGNLTIAEEVGEGDVTLNNITVDGDTYVRGGGKNSIHINGGDYNKITVMQTSSGQVRIVATNTAGMEVVVSEDAKGEDIILEGAFESVQIDAPDIKISTQGEKTTIKDMVVAKQATGSEITLDKNTTVEKLNLNAGVEMKGEGAVKEATVNSDNVTFEKAPEKETVAPEVSKPPMVTPPVVTPPVVPPAPDPGGGGGGGISSEDLLVAEYTNATTKQAFIALLDKNALGLDLTGYASLDTAGKEWVGSLLLKQDSFSNKTVVQTSVKTAIGSAVTDMQQRAVDLALTTYTPSLSAMKNYIEATYVNDYTDDQKKLMGDLYRDYNIALDRPLADGESIEINVFDKTLIITNQSVTDNAFKLFKTLGKTPISTDLITDMSDPLKISFIGKSLVTPVKVTAAPCFTRDSANYWFIANRESSLNVYPVSIDAYMNALTIDASNSKFTVTYAGINEALKPGLAGYYADALLNLDTPLEAGDIITIKAFGAEIPVTNALVTDTQIRLSELLKLTYTDANLAANQTGSFEISITSKVLKKDHFMTARAILVKGDEVIELENFNAMSLRQSFIDAYTNSITFPPSGTLNEISIAYGGLKDSDKTALTGYYADTLISMGQTLTEGETFTLNALGKKITITSATPSQSQVRLSSLLNAELDNSQLAGNKTGVDTIFADNIILNNVVNIAIQPVLVKTDGTIIYLERTNNLTVVPLGTDGVTPSCLADYAESIQKTETSGLSGAGSVVFSHNRDISEASKGILRNFYADLRLTLDRPLATGEEIRVQAYGKEVTFGSDRITETGGTQIRLSELLGQTLGEEQLAINMNNYISVNVVDQGIFNPITITAVPMLMNESTAPQYLAALATDILLNPWKTPTEVGVKYMGFVDSWDTEWTSDGLSLGIPESNPGYDAVQLQLTGTAIPADAKITYRTFSRCQTEENFKWTDYVSNGATAGDVTITDTVTAPIEAIQIKLENMPGYSVMYQVYVQGRGWQQWVSDDAMAGTTGCAQIIKAIRVRIVTK